MDVKLRFVQIPCKSGWPSDVYDNFQGFFSAVLVAVCALPAVFAPGVVWAATSAGTARAIAIATARVPARVRLRMLLPSIYLQLLSYGQYLRIPPQCKIFSVEESYGRAFSCG